MDFKDYYAALGVPKGASPAEIKRAYRKLARTHHPDVNAGDLAAERRFKEINEAHEVLGDPQKRRKYDELGANWQMYEQAGPGGSSPFARGSPFGAQWSTSGGAAGVRTVSPEEMEGLFGEGGAFSDFFQQFFSGDARRGRDIEQPITLTLEEAHAGTTRRLGLRTDGRTRRVEVKIPPGVRDGSRVRLVGKGEPGTGGATAGDLFLRVQQIRHATFTRRGQDLHVGVTVPVTTAVLGGTVPVPRVCGSPLGLKIPAATQSGQIFRLKGHGMPALGKTKAGGDLFATVSVSVPEQLTASQRQHYEALAALDVSGREVDARCDEETS